jgi:hypothetical protein
MSLMEKFLNKVYKDIEKGLGDINSDTDLESLVGIQPEDLAGEIIKNPGRFAWIAAMAAQAEYEESLVKAQLERIKSEKSLEIRQNAINKLTEDAIKAKVSSDEDVIDVQSLYYEKQRDTAVLQKLTQAMAQKSDLLRTLASNSRQEIASEITVMKSNLNKILGDKE